MYENQRISDLILLLIDCDWKPVTTKRFYSEFQKGDRILTLTEEDGDCTLLCKNVIPDYKVIQLPFLAKIDFSALYHILEAYGVTTLMGLAKKLKIEAPRIVESAMEVA
ncbi:MAG: hypothetical protein WC756_03550 [Taibaiella sp.]|jgi:hypothetical protein